MLLIEESWVNATRGHRCGESGLYEPFTDDIGVLFRAMQREHGRCVSSVYVDAPDGRRLRVGWCFQKRQEYADARPSWPDERRYYLAETWVMLYEREPTRTCTHHYREL
jgi:hypothetical protein